LGLKNNHKELIRIGALVGVTNSENPFDTQIIYTSTQSAASIQPACTLENCIGDNCQAWPGTRYIKLAQMFEWNSSIKSICTNSDLLDYLASWVACPSYFLLPEPLLDPDLTAIFINDQPLPFFSCEIPNKIIPCYGAEDTSCPDQSQCTQTWTYQPSDSEYYLSENGSIQFASHIDLCSLSIDEEIDHYCIELICAVE